VVADQRERERERERDGGQKTKRVRRTNKVFLVYLYSLSLFSLLCRLNRHLLKIENPRNDEKDKDNNNDGWIGGAKQREESAIEDVAEQEGASEVRISCLIVSREGSLSTTLSLKRSFYIFFSSSSNSSLRNSSILFVVCEYSPPKTSSPLVVVC